MIDIREILVRIFSAIFLSMCTGSCMFVFWMALRKFFADKIRPKVYDLILKIILIAYYVPAGYLKDAFHARCMCKRSLKIVKESLEFADQ